VDGVRNQYKERFEDGKMQKELAAGAKAQVFRGVFGTNEVVPFRTTTPTLSAEKNGKDGYAA
jgi:hypothetical protein